MSKNIIYLAICKEEEKLVTISVHVPKVVEYIDNTLVSITKAVTYAKLLLKDEPYIPVDVVGVFCLDKNDYDWVESMPDYQIEKVEVIDTRMTMSS